MAKNDIMYYTALYTVSVLGREEGYTVKNTRLPEGVPKCKATGEGVYFTIYPDSSPNTDGQSKS